MQISHFEEQGRINPVLPEQHMPEEIYQQALDHLVFACVDLVFTYNQQVLLAKRNTYPRPSWWIVGGRMAAGESPTDTAQRKAAKEAGIKDLHPSRFECIGVYSTCFAIRYQPPQNHGSHSLNVTYQIELTHEEKVRLKLRSDEYEDWKWVQLSEVNTFLVAKDVMDLALLQVMKDLAQKLAGTQPPV